MMANVIIGFGVTMIVISIGYLFMLMRDEEKIQRIIENLKEYRI